MTTSLLSNDLRLEPSQLYVANLPAMLAFYRDHVGLEVLSSGKDSALLGHNHTGIIELIEKPKLAHAAPNSAGLFHNAIVFDTRGELSRAAGRIATELPHLFSGTGDHLVSEAFYFNDPEGNGVELYFDRPADTWVWQNGHVAMDTKYIDPADYIMTHAGEQGARDKKLGHVHLRIGNILQAKKFYVDLLGFDVTADLPGALFVSIGGYHHHIGLNTWMSADAPVRTPSLGLSEVTITLESQKDVDSLASRLEAAGTPFVIKNDGLHVDDPWKNPLVFVSA